MSKTRIYVDRLPAFFLFNRAIVGSFSLSTGKERYILNETAYDFNGYRETPSHHFGEICKEIRFARKGANFNSTVPYPYKAIRFRHPACVYMDISAAYYQIASVYGLECSWKEGKHFAYGETDPGIAFRENKLIRSLLVSGTGLQSTMKEWKNHDFTTRKYPNKLYAPYLRSAIVRTLHAIQSRLDRYTIYGHTDGFIIRLSDLQTVSSILESYHLRYTIKYTGRASIYGVGMYRIGDHQTRNNPSSRSRNQGDRSNIREHFDDWWLNVFRRGVELNHVIRSDDNRGYHSNPEYGRIDTLHSPPAIDYPRTTGTDTSP